MQHLYYTYTYRPGIPAADVDSIEVTCWGSGACNIGLTTLKSSLQFYIIRANKMDGPTSAISSNRLNIFKISGITLPGSRKADNILCLP